jgi:hypothetical protein
MKAIKFTLLIMVLLSLVMLAGCQEGYAHKADENLTIRNQIAWEPTQTGFWRPKVD